MKSASRGYSGSRKNKARFLVRIRPPDRPPQFPNMPGKLLSDSVTLIMYSIDKLLRLPLDRTPQRKIPKSSRLSPYFPKCAEIPIKAFAYRFQNLFARFPQCSANCQRFDYFVSCLQTPLRHFPFGDILRNPSQSIDLARLVAHWKRSIMNPTNRPVRTHYPILLVVLARNLFPQRLQYSFAIFPMNRLHPISRRCIQALARSSPNHFVPGTDVNDFLLARVSHPEHFANVLCQLPKSMFALLQRQILALQLLMLLLQQFIRLAPTSSLFCFPQRSLHCRNQAKQPVFENVIRCSFLDDLY